MRAFVEQHTAYCLRCNEYRRIGGSSYVTSNSGRRVLKGACEGCGSEIRSYADDVSSTSGMPNAGENLILKCPTCGEGAGKQCVERQVGNAWNVGYPANIHGARAEITTPAAKSVEREAVRQREAVEATKRDAEKKERRKKMWKEVGIFLIVAVVALLTLGIGLLLLIAVARRP